MVPPPPLVGRTQSGLVKRAPGGGQSTTVGAGEPSGELLDALLRHNANLQRGEGDGTGPWARTGLWGPLEPVGSEGRGDRGAAAYPPYDQPGPGDLAGRYPPRDEPMPEAPAAWASPPPPRPTAPPPRPEPAASPAAQVPPPDAGQGGITSGGLTRRVRGAQMPATEPLLMRRGSGPGSGPAANGGSEHSSPVPTAGGGHRDPLAPPRPADDVYSFLSNFTAGVQRGLRETPRPNGQHER
jgi:hypothetical protein